MIGQISLDYIVDSLGSRLISIMKNLPALLLLLSILPATACVTAKPHPNGAAGVTSGFTASPAAIKTDPAAFVRGAFARCHGALGEIGCVTHLFERVGAVSYPPAAASADDMLEAAVEAGADDCESSDHGHEVACEPDRLGAVREALERRFGPAQNVKLVWRAQATVPVDEHQASVLFKLLESLEDSDDVQTVSANYDVSDDVMAKLSA